IVGKKPRAYSPKIAVTMSLQRSNMNFINNLSTTPGDGTLNNLWAICGSPVNHAIESRMVVSIPFDMPVMSHGRP
ncbi:MAG: hypothetical protein Q8N17_21685, partial [Burkholderiaceae bacterium]|nr:hypothetical protein [Burkholderiaceae bacterium]